MCIQLEIGEISNSPLFDRLHYCIVKPNANTCCIHIHHSNAFKSIYLFFHSVRHFEGACCAVLPDIAPFFFVWFLSPPTLCAGFDSNLVRREIRSTDGNSCVARTTTINAHQIHSVGHTWTAKSDHYDLLLFFIYYKKHAISASNKHDDTVVCITVWKRYDNRKYREQRAEHGREQR